LLLLLSVLNFAAAVTLSEGTQIASGEASPFGDLLGGFQKLYKKFVAGAGSLSATQGMT